LHGQNPPVIHCDIKPSNILLGEKIYLTKNLFGLKFYSTHPSAKKDISHLIFTAKKFTTDWMGQRIKITPQPMTWAGCMYTIAHLFTLFYKNSYKFPVCITFGKLENTHPNIVN
jgi:serine/threonine protein kinase